MSAAESMFFLARHHLDGGDEEDPEFLKHVAAVYREIHSEIANPDVVIDQFAYELNTTIFLIRLLDAGIPEDMAIRATFLLDEDDEKWFISAEDQA